MTRQICILLLGLFSQIIVAKSIDLPACLDTSNQIDRSIIDARRLMYSNADSSDKLFQQIFRRDEFGDREASKAFAFYYYGTLQFVKYANVRLGIEYLHKALDKSEKSECPQAGGIILSKLALAYRTVNALDTSLIYYQRAIELNEQYDRHARSWKDYLGISEVHQLSLNIELAEKYLLKALATTRQTGIRKDYGFALYHAMGFYGNRDRNKHSDIKEEYLQNFAKKKKWNDVELQIVHGDLHLVSDNNDSDLEDRLLEHLKVHQQRKNRVSIGDTYEALGKLALRQARPEKAKQYFESSLAAVNHFPKSKLGIYHMLRFTHQKLNDHKIALKYAQKAYELNDSITRVENTFQINQLEVEFETNKREEEIQRLDLENNLHRLEIKQSKRKMLIATLGALLLLCGLIAVTYTKRRQRMHIQVLNQKNEIIASALKDKNILLKEIHHRVKNNLQVISSLLYLQSHYTKDAVAHRALQDGQNRVKSMALIHKNLYQSENLTGIEMKSYFDKLIQSLFASYNIPNGQVLLDKQVDPISLDVETVIPIALIINELVSNSLKHAFKSDMDGELKIELEEEENKLRLAVHDNGDGLPDYLDFLESDSLGFELVRIFAEKLDASIRIKNEGGCTVELLINKYKRA